MEYPTRHLFRTVPTTITLESWFTTLKQTALNHCQPLLTLQKITPQETLTLFIIHLTTHLCT